MSAGRFVIEGRGPFFITDLAEPNKQGTAYRTRDDAEAELARVEAKHTPKPRPRQDALFDRQEADA